MIENLVPDNPTHLETLLAPDGVDDHIAVDADEVLAIENGVLVLAGGVDDLCREVLVPMPDDFAKRVFYRRVVGVDEVAVHVLDCERAFACAWYVRSGAW